MATRAQGKKRAAEDAKAAAAEPTVKEEVAPESQQSPAKRRRKGAAALEGAKEDADMKTESSTPQQMAAFVLQQSEEQKVVEERRALVDKLNAREKERVAAGFSGLTSEDENIRIATLAALEGGRRSKRQVKVKSEDVAGESKTPYSRPRLPGGGRIVANVKRRGKKKRGGGDEDYEEGRELTAAEEAEGQAAAEWGKRSNRTEDITEGLEAFDSETKRIEKKQLVVVQEKKSEKAFLDWTKTKPGEQLLRKLGFKVPESFKGSIAEYYNLSGPNFKLSIQQELNKLEGHGVAHPGVILEGKEYSVLTPDERKTLQLFSGIDPENSPHAIGFRLKASAKDNPDRVRFALQFFMEESEESAPVVYPWWRLLELGGLAVNRREAVRDWWATVKPLVEEALHGSKSRLPPLRTNFTSDQLIDGLMRAVRAQDLAAYITGTAVYNRLKQIDDPKRPVRLIFAGPSGTGKSAMVAKLKSMLFGDNLTSEQDHAIYKKVDFTTYQDDFAVNRLIGSPPGLTGGDQPGELPLFFENLTEEALEARGDTRPIAGILHIEEADKATGPVFEQIMELFDVGEIQAANQEKKRYRVPRLLIVLSTNLASQASKTALSTEDIFGPLPTNARDATKRAQTTLAQLQIAGRKHLAKNSDAVAARLGTYVPFFHFSPNDQLDVVRETLQRQLSRLANQLRLALPKHKEGFVFGLLEGLVEQVNAYYWDKTQAVRSIELWASNFFAPTIATTIFNNINKFPSGRVVVRAFRVEEWNERKTKCFPAAAGVESQLPQSEEKLSAEQIAALEAEEELKGQTLDKPTISKRDKEEGDKATDAEKTKFTEYFGLSEDAKDLCSWTIFSEGEQIVDVFRKRAERARSSLGLGGDFSSTGPSPMQLDLSSSSSSTRRKKTVTFHPSLEQSVGVSTGPEPMVTSSGHAMETKSPSEFDYYQLHSAEDRSSYSLKRWNVTGSFAEPQLRNVWDFGLF